MIKTHSNIVVSQAFYLDWYNNCFIVSDEKMIFFCRMSFWCTRLWSCAARTFRTRSTWSKWTRSSRARSRRWNWAWSKREIKIKTSSFQQTLIFCLTCLTNIFFSEFFYTFFVELWLLSTTCSFFRTINNCLVKSSKIGESVWNSSF